MNTSEILSQAFPARPKYQRDEILKAINNELIKLTRRLAVHEDILRKNSKVDVQRYHIRNANQVREQIRLLQSRKTVIGNADETLEMWEKWLKNGAKSLSEDEQLKIAGRTFLMITQNH